MVVWQDVGEPVLGTVDGQVGRHTRLIPANVFEAVKLFRETEIRIRCHTSVVLSKILQLDGSPNLMR